MQHLIAEIFKLQKAQNWLNHVYDVQIVKRLKPICREHYLRKL